MTDRSRLLRLTREVLSLSVEDQAVIVDAISDVGSTKATITEAGPEASDVALLVDAVCEAELPPREVARLVEKLEPSLPPRDRQRQDQLVREYVALHLPAAGSGRELHRAFLAAIDAFERSAEGRSALLKTVCPLIDKRKALLWRILRFGPAPRKTHFFERILESE
jgi:hypothetical protein